MADKRLMFPCDLLSMVAGSEFENRSNRILAFAVQNPACSNSRINHRYGEK